MKKFRYALIALIGLSTAALIGTASDAPKGCGCSIKPQVKLENPLAKTYANVKNLVKQGRAWVNQISNSDGTSSSQCTAYVSNHLRWSAPPALIRPVPATAAKSMTEIA